MNRRTFAAKTGATIGAATAGGAGDGVRAAGDEAAGALATDGGEDTDPSIIAHRGYAGAYPENTVGAVKRASETAGMIEVDAVPTADGKVVAFHDDRLGGRDGGARGLTDEEGYVWETPWEAVREAEVLGSGETVPSIQRVVDAIPADVGVNIEFKNPGSTDVTFARSHRGEELAVQMELWRPMAEATLRIADGAANEVLVSSFYEAALAVVRELAPDVPVAFLFRDSVETGLRITETYDCEAIHPPRNLVGGGAVLRR